MSMKVTYIISVFIINRTRLAHLARHAPLNARVNYAVGSSPTGSITKQFMKQFQSVKCCIYPVSLLV